MSARDDYPPATHEWLSVDVINRALDEIDLLRAERDLLRRAYETIAAVDDGVEAENRELRVLLDACTAQRQMFERLAKGAQPQPGPGA